MTNCQLLQIQQLRMDLDWAKQQVTCLAASLRTNVRHLLCLCTTILLTGGGQPRFKNWVCHVHPFLSPFLSLHSFTFPGAHPLGL